MEQLKSIKQCLVNSVSNQLEDLKKTDAKELGEVIDMIKDLEEAMYYCAIIEAMERTEDEKRYYYTPHDWKGNKNDNSGISSISDYRMYTPYMEYAPYMMRDQRWRDEHFGDRSGMSRRMYMEGKQYHGDDQQSMKELEHYIKDLGDDLTDMIKESSTEEKQVLSSKLQQLATKINK